MSVYRPPKLSRQENDFIDMLVDVAPFANFRIKQKFFPEYNIINIKNSANLNCMQIRSYPDGRVRFQLRKLRVNAAEFIDARYDILSDQMYGSWNDTNVGRREVIAHMAYMAPGGVENGRIKAITIRPPQGELHVDMVLARHVLHYRVTTLNDKPAYELTLGGGDDVKVLVDSAELGNRMRHLFSGAIHVVNAYGVWNLYNYHRFEGIFEVTDCENFISRVKEAKAA